MAIIRDLEENENLIEPSTRGERITFWNYYYRNTKYPYGTIDCKWVDLDMFSSYKNSISSNSDDSSVSDSDSFPLLLS